MTKRVETTQIVLHTAATPWRADIGVREIDVWHKARGWSGCGYHFVVRRDGKVEAGRPLDEVGAHVAGHNERSVAVCWVGGVADDGAAEDNRTEEQRVVLPAVVAVLRALYPEAEVLGHRDFPQVAKDCPCFDARTEYGRTVQNG